MNRGLVGVLFVAFVPGIVLVIAGAISAVRTYGVSFLWWLRFEPVREKLWSLLREMHPAKPVVIEAEYDGQDLPQTALVVTETRELPRSAPVRFR
jgi:hypothetical protein